MARKDITMTEDEIAGFLEHPHTLQVASVGKEGTPHLAPMWFAMLDGKIAFRSFSKSQKIINLNRNPKLAVLAEEGKAYAELRGLMIRGEATLITDPDVVLSVYGELSARYPMVGDKPQPLSDEELEAAFGRFASKNTVVIVEPHHVTSWDHRKLGGAY